MSRRARRVGVMVLAVLSTMTAGAALAWACTPSAFTSLTPSSGGPGATTTVRGEGFVEGPVEVRWASTGAVLATATGPKFSVAVTIPADAPAGAHYIQSVARNQADGAVAGEHIRAFEVTDPNAAQPQPEPQPRPENRALISPTPRPQLKPQLRAETAPTPAAPQPQVQSPAVASPPAAPVAEPAAEPQPEQPAERPTQRADDPIRRSGEARSTPSEASALGDLWGGVAPGERSSAAAGLTEAAAEPGGTGSQLVPGIVLLSLGLATLLGGTGTLMVRKRRRAAGGDADRLA